MIPTARSAATCERASAREKTPHSGPRRKRRRRRRPGARERSSAVSIAHRIHFLPPTLGGKRKEGRVLLPGGLLLLLLAAPLTGPGEQGRRGERSHALTHARGREESRLICSHSSLSLSLSLPFPLGRRQCWPTCAPARRNKHVLRRRQPVDSHTSPLSLALSHTHTRT